MSFFNIKDFTSGLAAKIHTILVNTDENIAVHAMTGTAGNLINPAQEDGNLASLAAKDFATQTTLSAVLTKLSADPATQTTLAALLAKDFATHTTLAAVLAKMVASPALEGGNLATIAGKDFATQTTLAAVLAKLTSDPSTGTLQSTGNASIATIAAKDFATQTTLAAILAKMTADPATATLQGSGVSLAGSGVILLNTISNKDFATQTTLLAINSLLSGTSGTFSKITDGLGNNVTLRGSSTGPAAPTDVAMVVTVRDGNANGRALDINSTPVAISTEDVAVIEGRRTSFVRGMAVAMSGTATTSLLAAGGSATFNYVTAVTISNTNGTVGTEVVLQDGSGGTSFWTFPAAAGFGGATIQFYPPLKQPTANTGLFCKNTITGASVTVSVNGFTGA